MTSKYVAQHTLNKKLIKKEGFIKKKDHHIILFTIFALSPHRNASVR